MLVLLCAQGLSGRPPFSATDRASAEDFFLESLNAWRSKQGLDKFILVGHSLGELLPRFCFHIHSPQICFQIHSPQMQPTIFWALVPAYTAHTFKDLLI